MGDPYVVLGLSSRMRPTLSEVKDRYLQLAKQHHPDSGGDERTFKHVLWAYQRLKDIHNDVAATNCPKDPNTAPEYAQEAAEWLRQRRQQTARSSTTRRANPKVKAWWYIQTYADGQCTFAEFMARANTQSSFTEWCARAFDDINAQTALLHAVFQEYQDSMRASHAQETDEDMIASYMKGAFQTQQRADALNEKSRWC
jgi:hypothetical protein